MTMLMPIFVNSRVRALLSREREVIPVWCSMTWEFGRVTTLLLCVGGA